MLEFSDNEINVDELMYAIREDVAQRNGNSQRPARLAETPSPTSAPSHLATPDKISSSWRAQFPQLRLQPEFHPREDDQYHVNDLLKYHDQDFVRNAYLAILKREPDDTGFTRHLANLRSGEFNKLDVLASLRNSPEGKRKQVHVAGLKWPATMRRLGRAPFIGYFVQTIIGLARLPVSIRQHRQSEAYVLAQQQQFADAINRAHMQLAERFDYIAATISHLTARAEQTADQQQQQQQHLESLLEKQQEFFAEKQREVVAEMQQEILAAQKQLKDELQIELDDVQKVARQEVKVLAQQTTERMAEAHERFARLNEHLENQEQQSENQERQLENQKQQSENQERQFSQSLQQTRTALTMQERRVAVLLEEAGKLASGDFDQRSAQVFTDEREHLQDAHYVSFEDKFRGSREDIKERLRVYLPVIKDAGITGEMLDVGSGRGEWLQLLKDEGFEGRGVDNNRVLVEQCRTSGLDVVEEDFITYLRGLPDGSLNAVTSFHLIEHLPFETLNKFLDEIIRTLKPGGVVILETPDPENVLVGSCYFYLDPTHRNPIPSLTMQFLLEARGFNDVQVLKLHPWESAKIKGDTELVALINKYFFGPFDYGIIARKI